MAQLVSRADLAAVSYMCRATEESSTPADTIHRIHAHQSMLSRSGRQCNPARLQTEAEESQSGSSHSSSAPCCRAGAPLPGAEAAGEVAQQQGFRDLLKETWGMCTVPTFLIIILQVHLLKRHLGCAQLRSCTLEALFLGCLAAVAAAHDATIAHGWLWVASDAALLMLPGSGKHVSLHAQMASVYACVRGRG